MNDTRLNPTKPWQLSAYAGVNVWLAGAFAVFAFILTESEALWLLFHSQTGVPEVHHVHGLRAPAAVGMIFLLAGGTIFNIRRLVLFATDDPAVLRAILYYFMLFIGFVFVALSLVL